MTWPLARVGTVATQIRGVSYKKQDAADSPAPSRVAILRAMNITESGLTFEPLVYVPAERVNDNQILQAGDVVVAASSGSISSFSPGIACILSLNSSPIR